MQDFTSQAHKNGVLLYQQGPCQFCGAAVRGGVFECVEIYSTALGLDYNDSAHHLARFLSVDAHALQHPEIHGRWSNHFHLTRLHLLLTHQVYWTYQHSPGLSQLLNQHKLAHPQEVLTPPPLCQRGALTASDLVGDLTAEQTTNLVYAWATEVYRAWQPTQEVVELLAQQFLANLLPAKGA